MGRVKPQKVISGRPITGGELNATITDFQNQSESVDNFNVRDEALGSEELENSTFVRNFSYFTGSGQCTKIGNFRSRQFPVWSGGDYFLTGGSSTFVSVMGGGRPHSRALNNAETNDVTIVRVSCDIYVKDYGFQTYNYQNQKRFHGPIMKVSVGLNTDIDADATMSGFSELQRTIRHYQLPWSGAKWKMPDQGPGPLSGIMPDGTAFLRTRSDVGDGGFYNTIDGSDSYIQWPYPRTITREDTDTAMAFDYVFNYQTTVVWKPTGTGVLSDGSHNGVFALMVEVLPWKEGAHGPAWGETTASQTPTRTYFSVSTEDVDGVEETVYTPYEVKGRLDLVRQSAEFDGLYVRNCEMNSYTYTQAR
jgi:hypothetical protein